MRQRQHRSGSRPAIRYYRTDLLSLAQRIWRYEYNRRQTDEGAGKGECPVKETGGGTESGQRNFEGCQLKKLLSPVKRKAAVADVVLHHGVSQRRACRVLKVNRTAARYEPVRLPNEDEVRADIIDKATNIGRVGYRMVTNMMPNEGRKINHNRVEIIGR